MPYTGEKSKNKTENYYFEIGFNYIYNHIMSCKVSFIGLGVMGYPMAGYISKAGHNVTVYNRTKSKAEKWIKEYKGKIAETPEEASKESDFVFSCVGNDDDLKEVAIGKKGIFNSIKKGSIYIDNTTASATVARELHKNAKAHGFGFLDAPVSGGQAGAEKGALTVMVGGDKKDFDKAKDIINCYSKKVQLLGPSGSGQLAKMVNQICIAGLVQGLSEAINFGINSGLKMEDVIDVISKAGHNVTVYNRTKSKAEKWVKEYKGKIAETPEEASKESDFVFTCVGNDEDFK